jgi:zinc transport system substrate-binding protein
VRQFLKFLTIIFACTGIVSCGQQETGDQTTAARPAEIIVVNSPLHYFTSELIADLATVTLLAPGEIDPSTWEPHVNDILKLQQAELVILNGAGYSGWLDRVALTASKLVDTGAAFRSDLIPVDQQTTHSHGPTAEHSHGAHAFTTWMDMELAKSQVHAIALALTKNWPMAADEITQREADLIEKLTNIDETYSAQAGNLRARTIIYSHPVYQYFDRRYQLHGRALHWEPDQQPTAQQWEELERLTRGAKNVLLIWEDFPNDSVVARLTQLNIQSVVVRPAANRSTQDWYTEQRDNFERINACCNSAGSL